MAWTAPKTWSSEPLTSLDLNTYVRDNQNHLIGRLDTGAAKLGSSSNFYTTTATEFVDVDATKLAITLQTHGGDVLIGFTGSVLTTNSNAGTYFNIAVDDEDYVADDGIIRNTSAASAGGDRHYPLSFVMLIRGLSAGGHTFKLRWKKSGNGTVKIDVVDLHPQFWAKEI